MIAGLLQFFPQVSAAGSKGKSAKMAYTAKLTANKMASEVETRRTKYPNITYPYSFAKNLKNLRKILEEITPLQNLQPAYLFT